MIPEPDRKVPTRRLRLRLPERYLRRISVAIVAAVMVLALVFRDRLPAPDVVAYPAVFILSFVGSASVFIPLPGLGSVCAGGVLLTPLIVGLVAGVAEAAGEITGYLAGFSGRGKLSTNRLYKRIQPWMQRRGWITVMVLATIPNPTFDVVGVAAGAAGMPLVRFLGAAWVGKTVKSTYVAYLCAFGLRSFVPFA